MWRLLQLCLVLVLASSGVEGELPPPERPYKILVPIPGTGRSHWNIFQPLLKALADRGHQIVTLQTLPQAFHHPNITEHVLQLGAIKPASRFISNKDFTGGLSTMEGPLATAAEKFYTIPVVLETYKRRREFDLVITDHMFNEMAYPLALGMLFMTLAAPGLEPCQSAVLGNVLSPAYAPNLLTDYPKPMSVADRLRNTFFHVYLAWYWRVWVVVPKIQEKVSAHLPDIPPLLDIERNISLTLLNSHTSLGTIVPLLPSQVEVGGMHCVPGKPLPQDLSSWLDGASPAGAVYFSLGSIARGTTVPVRYRHLFVEAFRRLDTRVIWKYESELEDMPGNVLTKEWLPQQDILADPRVRLFINHGGLLSTLEAMYHATPILVLPIFGDQTKNALSIVRQGFGLSLDWDDLTVDLIVRAIQQILDNPKYERQVREASVRLRDQPQPPLERAVYWTEYLIRHRGAPHLRCSASDLSWVELFMLDVLALLLLGAFISYLILCKILHRLRTLVTRGPGDRGCKRKLD